MEVRLPRAHWSGVPSLSGGQRTVPASQDVRARPGRSVAVRGRSVTFTHVPALDGLRAVAVLGVLLYHGGAPLSGGGFLGVNIFFVLSGFLITTLLVGEWGRQATIGLGRFWARRARRLLPALVLMLGCVVVVAYFISGGSSSSALRLDTFASLFYVANWHFIAVGSNYFSATGHPSLLEHTWSLAIEEQFYLVWPPLVLGLLTVGRRLRPSRRLWPVMGAAVGGAVASAAVMRLLYLHGASLTRIYEGTDTRSQDILVGAALAVGMALWAERRKQKPQRVPELGFGRVHPSGGTVGLVPAPAHRRDVHRRRGRGNRPIEAWAVDSRWAHVGIDGAGWLCLAGLLALWARLDGPGGGLFSGGEFGVAVMVAVVIFAVVTTPSTTLARVLATPVLRYIGVISYGIYLWHFPLFTWMDASRLHLMGLPLLAVRLAATVALAAASYHLVELPIRQRRFFSWDEWRVWLATAGTVIGVGVVTLAATGTAAPAAATAPASRPVHTEAAGPPVKIAILGDSVAWRLGFSLLAGQSEQAYDVSIDNAAIVGCGVLASTQYRAGGKANPMVAACNSSSPADSQWPKRWSDAVATFRPDVVVVLAGRWEVMDRWIGGRWAHIGQPAVDQRVRSGLEQAVAVASATGAYVDLYTAPCFDSGEQPNGQLWPEDSPQRLARYNEIVRSVASEHPRTVQVVDFDDLVCPQGRFTTSVNGVDIRDADGVHIAPTAATGQWLAARLLPEAVATGRERQSGVALNARPASTPVTASAAGVPAHRSPSGP